MRRALLAGGLLMLLGVLLGACGQAEPAKDVETRPRLPQLV